MSETKQNKTETPSLETTATEATEAKTKGRVSRKDILSPTKLSAKIIKDKPDQGPESDLPAVVAAAALEHKPIDPVLLDLSGLSSLADWFFIASADNPRQMVAIAEKIIRRAREHGVRLLGREGLSNDNWVLVDLGDVICHIFSPEARNQYDLEGLWAEAPRREVKEKL